MVGLVFLVIIFLVLMIIYVVKYYNAQDEIEKLKKQLQQYKSKLNTNNNGDNIVEKTSSNIKKENIKTSNIVKETIIEEKTKEINSQKVKNMLILIAGAVLIVLAAIVFLMSTWNTIPNIIKTGILIFLVGVFLGASYLADNKLKLKLTAKAFYYIAMAYIPIAMFSISVFELFGTYLSIFGDGKYFYFSLCAILLSSLYLIETIIHNRKPLAICSIITEILAVIFTVLIFSLKFYNILLGLQIYILIMYVFSKYKELNKLNLEFIKIVIPILHFVMSFIIIFSIMIHWIMGNCTVVDILSILFMTITYYLIQKKNRYLKFAFDIGLLLIVLTSINLKVVDWSGNIKFLIVTSSALLLYLFNYIRLGKIVYKIITYVILNFFILSVMLVFDLYDLIKYILFLTTLIVLLVEMINKHKGIKYYLVPSFGIAFFLLNIEINIASYICILILIGIFIAYINNEKISKWFMAIPMLSLMPSLFITSIDLLKPYNLNIIISLVLIILTTSKSIIDKKINNIYLFGSIAYILLSISTFEMNKYINLLLILLWAVVHAVTNEYKDIFKVISYITSLAIYNTFISDINFTSLTIVNIAGYLGCTYLITRTVLKKHIKAYKILEYVFASIIYIYALYICTGITDAMIFIIFLLAFVIFGYIKKVGPLFLTSLITIVLNTFKLTKEFWQSIPWWVYMLVVGSILLSFAIRNEINEREEKVRLRDLVKRLKDNVDL